VQVSVGDTSSGTNTSGTSSSTSSSSAGPVSPNAGDMDWFAGVAEEELLYYSSLGNELDSLFAVVGSFVPPPPRPPYLPEETLPTDGLTTCDLCSWALRNDRYSFSLDGTLGKCWSKYLYNYTHTRMCIYLYPGVQVGRSLFVVVVVVVISPPPSPLLSLVCVRMSTRVSRLTPGAYLPLVYYGDSAGLGLSLTIQIMNPFS
jgi:hypothetical protein